MQEVPTGKLYAMGLKLPWTILQENPDEDEKAVYRELWPHDLRKGTAGREPRLLLYSESRVRKFRLFGSTRMRWKRRLRPLATVLLHHRGQWRNRYQIDSGIAYRASLRFELILHPLFHRD